MSSTIRIIRNICLLIALYYFIYYIYTGILNPIPTLGDDWSYHIPISKSILDGSFLRPPMNPYIPLYYPGSAEGINSILILLHIPLTLSSLFAIAALFYSCFLLAKTFDLTRNLAFIYATCFSTLTVVLRWANKVSIDTWLTVFFILSLVLLKKTESSYKYFLALGFTLGMLIGTKYTGTVFALLLLIMFGRNLLSYLSFTRIIVFLIPFSVFGLFWYIRNYFAVGSPMPICLGLHSCEGVFYYLWQALLNQPFIIANSLFGEYKLWLFAPLFLLGYLIRFRYKKYPEGVLSLTILGILSFLFYFTLPTSTEPWQNVSTVRYTLPAFAVMILATFILARHHKQEEYLGYFVIANMLPVLSMAYYPKLVLIYFPVSILSIFLLDRLVKR